MKKLVLLLYVLLIVVMAAATIVGHFSRAEVASSRIYGAWWFSLLWALLVAAGTAYIVQSRLRRWNVLLLHFSMIVILAGALLTHVTSFSGTLHLRSDQPTDRYMESGPAMGKTHALPFTVRLDRFDVDYHSGTAAAADYTTLFSIIDGEKTVHAQVSMNRIYDYRGVRFYQSGFDEDRQGSYLSINSDRYGMPVTYAGYGLLFFSLVWLLIDPKGTFRRLLRSDVLKKGLVAAAMLLLLAPRSAAAAETTIGAPLVPRDLAESFGRLYMDYNDRICPVQTFALDFVKKLYGKPRYHGATAEQVLMSWMLFGNGWQKEPIVHVKSRELRERLLLPEYAAVDAFFQNGEYVLGPYAYEYQEGQHDAFHKACADIDGKLQIVMNLQGGLLMAMFPHTFSNGQTQWFSPGDELPRSLSPRDAFLMKNLLPVVGSAVGDGDNAQAALLIEKLRSYQLQHAGHSLPRPVQVKAELLYNRIPFATILFMFNLTLGFIALFALIRKLTSPASAAARSFAGWMQTVLVVLLSLSFLALTVALALRWTVSGSVPLSNGYESMLSVAWFAMLVTLVFALAMPLLRPVTVTFGFLVSGFFLLVSHISQMDPAIGPVMPVLNSPLLSIHVSIIMMSYALLGLTFICGVTAFVLQAIHRLKGKPQGAQEQLTSLMVLSQIFLYPAMVTLGAGIFIGAIWANVSWGAYWSWDPKETWALITFMVYAVLLHGRSWPVLRKPVVYHAFVVAAFLCILMTFFGVNYVLGGMHSYA